MKLRSLAAGVAIVALCAGAAQAATHHHRHARSAAREGKLVEPATPIAYSKLDDYLKASPAKQRSGNWGLDTGMAASAETGGGANVAATAPTPPPPESAPTPPPTESAPAAPPPTDQGQPPK